MKDQRLAFSPPVMNHFTEEDDVIAGMGFSNYATDKVSGGPFQQRATCDAVAAVNFGETVRELSCESAREMMLVRREDVNRKMTRFSEIQIFGGGFSQAPHHERRLKRDRCKGIYGEADASATLGAPGYDRDAGGKLAQRVAKIPLVEGARSFHG
jgi:hypothetical protein